MLDRLLFVGAVGLAVITLLVLVNSIGAMRGLLQDKKGNAFWTVAQTRSEVTELIDSLDRYQDADPGVDLPSVQMRFEVLRSRVVSSGRETLLPAGDPGVPESREIVVRLGGILAAFDPAMPALARDDRATIEALKGRLREAAEELRLMSQKAMDYEVEVDTRILRDQEQQSYLTLALIAATTLTGLMGLVLVRSDRQEMTRLAEDLESRVRARTEDLEAANTRLSAEIAERRRNQALAAEREARLSQAAQLAKLGYYIWNAVDDRCQYCSEQHAAAHGLTPVEYIQKASALDGPMDLTHPDDRERVRQKYRELRSGRIVEFEYRVLTPAGVRRLREVARPVFDHSGRVVAEIGSTLDVTEKHETEMKLFEAQKMDSIGKMTGGVAHDFNNLLAVILGNLELMRELPDSPDRGEMIDDAIRATLRGRDLAMSMLSFARRAPLDPRRLDLNQVLGEMRNMLRRTIPENIAIEFALGPDLWPVMADRSLTESAVLNLAINARDAMPRGGRLTIETANKTLGAEYLSGHDEEIVPGDYVMLAVTDTGCGIPPDVLENIFQPFFTTKAPARNSGLGLSMVHGFTRQTGGAIRVYSEVGAGTAFKLFFKAVDAQAPVDKGPVAMPAPHDRRGLRVLLVEDDDNVRKVLTRQLQGRGLTVVAAPESASAEKAFRNRGPFDVIVSDIVMPGDLQGPALVHRLRQIEPGLPAVFLSGYPQEATVHGNGVRPEDVMLMKPVSGDDLCRAIDQAVEDAGDGLSTAGEVAQQLPRGK